LGKIQIFIDSTKFIAAAIHLPLDPDTNVRVYDRVKIMKEVALTV